MESHQNTYKLVLASGKAVVLLENGVPLKEVKFQTLASTKKNKCENGLITESEFSSEDEMLASANSTRELWDKFRALVSFRFFRVAPDGVCVPLPVLK